MPVFAQALPLPHPPGRKHRCSACFFPFFSHGPPVPQCCLPNTTFLARTGGRQDRRGLCKAAASGGGPSPLAPRGCSPAAAALARPPTASLPRPPHLPGRLTLQHAPVGRVGDGVDVRRHLVPLLALVHFDDLLRVDGQLLVGIDHHAEEARVRLPNREPKLSSGAWQGESLYVQPAASLRLLSTTVYMFLLQPHSSAGRQRHACSF